MAKVSLRSYNREIETMMDRGQLDEAIAHCHHILKTFPKHLETYRLLGKAYLELKKHGDASDIFLRVLACVPNDFVSHVGMSIIRDEENKPDDAIWHMERAFEAQPSNAAIQGELQRLYGRRDGVSPPRIRMTRGALAQMYVQGELYPQAISEIKSVLKEDPGRSDMQSLLARACFRSGQKNEAAEVASSLLRRYPYSFDANRVLVEILGSDRPESVQAYRQRVIELDPYAAHVSGSILQTNDAPDSAVALERLDWNGQSVQSDWRTRQGISLEGGTDVQPEWLTGGFGESKTPPRFDEAQRELSTPTAGSAFDFSASSQTDSAPTNDDNIPDFLRQAGWGQSTGAFDESKPAFAEEETLPPTQAAPLAEGDMPDWVKAMAPAEALKPADNEEELPDWINKIGTGVLAASTDSSSDQPVSFAESSGDQPDWMKQLGQTDSPAPASSMPDDQPDWLKQLSGEPDPARTGQPSNDFDFLNQTSAKQPGTQPMTPATNSDDLGSSDQERDDSFAWLENLAAKQGATEGLLINPEDRLEQEPDWVKQAKSLNEQPEQPVAMPTQMEDIPAQPSALGLEELGKSEQERDDSFSWLENLAAKQGATEGLLIKPEDRLEQQPDWVQKAKEIGEALPPVQPEPASADTASWLRGLDDEESTPAPVKDDTAMWLKNLDEADAKPEPAIESSNDDTAMWLKSLDEPEVKPATPTDDMPAWMQNIEEEKTDSITESVVPAVEADDSSAWIETVEKSVASETPRTDTGSLPSWLRGLDGDDAKQSAPQDDLPAWLRDETGEVVAEPTRIEPTRAEEWQPAETMKSESFEAPVETPKPAPKPKQPAPAARKSEARPATPIEPYKEPVTRKGTGMLTQTVDMVLGQARNELNRSNIPGALETYAKLIKKGRYLDEVVFDLREALYRYPVEVSIWQSLGDAYMRANRLQDALDAYTKAEELLR